MFSFLSGLGVGFSLILAIGSQNAFILKQGLKKQYVFWVCLVCALSDSILILLGITGFSKVLQAFPSIIVFAKYFGAVFLLFYGARHFYSAFKNNAVLNPSDIDKTSLGKILAVCLALTWLNPHVYLDTVILVGSISVSFKHDIYFFTAGTILASWIFFFALGYGARFLLPLFKKSSAWKVLDFFVGITMWGIALKLLM